MTQTIAGIAIPDSSLAVEATELVRDTTNELIFNHSRRVFLFGSLRAQALNIRPEPELLYVAALFHDLGLVAPYKNVTQRFELDGAGHAREFLTSHGISDANADEVWTAIALHTTPEVPYRMSPVIAATTAGVEADVLGINLGSLSESQIGAITAAHPRPDFKKRILQAFFDGFSDRPDTTFGTVNADVLEHFRADFRHIDFVDVIRDSAWSE
ncbi:HD domain-containing protein [Cryobacterium soli]|uniref:HD domain-containing protein n=1 Tax=Cryobacterium soli TaxID=2220095 RepID=UPI000E716728|nr:HD domain-containing protein [Cryobacterium soli]